MTQQTRQQQTKGADPKPAPEPKKGPPSDDEVGKALHAYLTERSDTIAKFVRKDSALTAAALVQAAGTAFRREPEKMRDERSWRTVVTALIVAAQFDLEPLGREGWLIPREVFRKDANNRRVSLGFFEWTFMPSYQGLTKLAILSGRVRSIRSQVVYENDHIEIQLGSDGRVDHRPCLTGARGFAIGVYAVARMVGSEDEIEWLSQDDVLRIKEAASDYSAAWKSWPEEMARKSAIKRLTKQLPAGAAFAAAVQLDNALESGEDGKMRDAIEAALRDKLALLPEAQRSSFLDAVDRGSQPVGSTKQAAFAARVSAMKAAAPGDDFGTPNPPPMAEGPTSTRLARGKKAEDQNLSCKGCGTDVQVVGVGRVVEYDVVEPEGDVYCAECSPLGGGDR